MLEIQFNDLDSIKQQIYWFSETFDYACVFDSGEVSSAMNHNTYELIAGIGMKTKFSRQKDLLFKQIDNSQSWIFGNINYQSMDKDNIAHELFEPKIILTIASNSKTLQWINNGIDETAFEILLERFNVIKTTDIEALKLPKPQFEAQTPYEKYIQMVEQIKADIVQGVYYEMNYCMAFQSRFETQSLLPIHLKLIKKSPAPFAAYLKNPQFSLTCNSPERFIKRDNETIVSQPIKGTNPKIIENNHIQIEALKNSEKNRAENVMIVDLVRNDLSKICQTASVKVSELFGTYTFKSLNHLISSIEGKLKRDTDLKSILEALFPMGSMTGAPKIEVMKHIEKYEDTQRGIYSGCLGYIKPNKDFDFNVVIRSIELNHAKETMIYKVGGAITFDSIAEDEYQECLLKAKNILSVF